MKPGISERLRELIDRVLARTGSPLEWSTVDKSLAALGVITCVGIYYTLWGHFVVNNPEAAPFINTEFMARAIQVQAAEVALWLVLIAVGFGIRKKHPESRLFTHTFIQLYAACNALGIWAMGQFSVSAGVILLGNAMVAFLLFDLWFVLPALIPTATILGTTAWGSWSGTIPYAPLLASNPFEPGGRVAGWWLANFWSITIVISMGTFIAFGIIVFLWRDREEKLARAYNALNVAKDQLIRAESLAAVGSLVTGAAHELRNPLSSSSAVLQSLREELAETPDLAALSREDLEQSVDLSLRGQQRAAAIVERLYRLSDDLDLTGSRVRVEDFARALCEKYQGLRLELAPEAADLRVTEVLFRGVLPNLLDNAAAAGADTPPIVRFALNGNWLRIVVEDEGRGIPEALQERVFQPFASGTRRAGGEGVGLGLYIAHELVNRLGGQIHLESKEGEGTSVRVEVPLEALVARGAE